jgi:SAM-dependent methyltransferase
MGVNIMMPPSGEWIVEGIDRSPAEEFLLRHQPWRMELQFASGPKASDFQIFQPFNRIPLNKLRLISQQLPEDTFKNARVLDIGANVGYNSLYLASEFNCKVTGIDVVPKHKLVTDELASMVGADVEFLLESAEDFQRPGEFDIILHLGTLYHLANPVRSIERCFRSLKSGGWFALETIGYRSGGDRDLCKWINGYAGDKTNYWALGEGAIEAIARYSGIGELKLVLEVSLAAYEKEMFRGLWIGRRSE